VSCQLSGLVSSSRVTLEHKKSFLGAFAKLRKATINFVCLFLIKPKDALIFQIYFVKKLSMLRAVPLPIIRSLMTYTSAECTEENSTCFGQFLCPSSGVWWHIPVPNAQRKTPDDGHRNCTKHVEFFWQNKFGKIVHLLVLLKINLLRCTVTWT
jgi:hypothetical protein